MNSIHSAHISVPLSRRGASPLPLSHHLLHRKKISHITLFLCLRCLSGFPYHSETNKEINKQFLLGSTNLTYTWLSL